jgi:dTDP-4-dehydrorhamnose reductase
MAMEINAEGTKKVAMGVRNINSRMIYISTDYVFNGKKDTPYIEEDKPDPISVYGESKYRGELYLAETLTNYCIVRTAWLYSHQPQSFVKKILKVARERGEVSVVDDQKGSPTYVDDLAFHLIPLLKSKYRGIFNITNSGSTTWYCFAVEIFKILGMDEISVNSVRTEEFPLKAQRPKNSILSIDKYEETIGIEMPDWKDGLLRFIEEYGTRL